MQDYKIKNSLMKFGGFINKFGPSLGVRGMYFKLGSLVTNVILILVVNQLTSTEAFQYFTTIGFIYIVTFFTGGGLNKFILSVRSNQLTTDIESVINFIHSTSILIVTVASFYFGAIVFLGGLFLIITSYLQSQFFSKTDSRNENIQMDNKLILAEIVSNMLTSLFLVLRYIKVAVLMKPFVILLISLYLFNFRLISVSPTRFISYKSGILREIIFSSLGRLFNIFATRGLVYTTQGVFSVDELKIVGILEKISTVLTSILNWFWNRIYLYFGYNKDYSYNSKMIFWLLPFSWIALLYNSPISFVLSLTFVRIVKEYSSYYFIARFSYIVPFYMSVLFLVCVLMDMPSSTAIIFVFSIYSLLALLRNHFSDAL